VHHPDKRIEASKTCQETRLVAFNTLLGNLDKENKERKKEKKNRKNKPDSLNAARKETASKDIAIQLRESGQ
jgi:hypothetical protein